MTIKTRTVAHEDGRIEVVRLLDPESLQQWEPDDPLGYERSIVWLEDVSQLPYVRQQWISTATSRTGALHWRGDGRLVGYSKLTADAPKNEAGHYVRRIFYLRSSDPVASPDDYPPNAVDPKSILPGEPAKRVGPARGNGAGE